jgi:hypothetical protein
MLRIMRAAAMAAAIICAAAAGLTAPAAAADPAGPVLLTVAGEVSKPNRGAMDPFLDGVLNANNQAFAKATTFARADLNALPQVEITASAEGWPAPVRLQGVRLADVLEAAGASGRAVTVFALDNYGVKLSPEEIRARDWVLAHSAGGAPLAIGGRGPMWLAWDTTASGPASKEQEGQWVWAVYLVTVE